jgi:hypothetical protein
MLRQEFHLDVTAALTRRIGPPQRKDFHSSKSGISRTNLQLDLDRGDNAAIHNSCRQPAFSGGRS